MAFKECPICECRCRVINSRVTEEFVRRRYKCDECKHVFTTAEVMIEHGERTGRESAKLWAQFVNVQTARKMRSLVDEMQRLLTVSTRSEPKSEYFSRRTGKPAPPDPLDDRL